MSKPWESYALHILDAVAKIRSIQTRGDLTQDEVLYDSVGIKPSAVACYCPPTLKW